MQWKVFMSVVALFASTSIVQALTIDLVYVGNAGNKPDTTGYGAVSYDYRIGKYEITAGQYCEFLNAVADADTYGLYSTYMLSNGYGCKIQRTGSSASYSYSVASDYANRPVNYVSWGDAARFCNWLHNGQPIGAQDLSTTEDGAYYLNGATSDSALMAVVREVDAKWWIPSENEWYKAAYHKNDGATGNYFYYPTSSNSIPSNDLVEPNDPGNNATFSHIGYTIGSPYYRTEIGAHEISDSPYGTFDQGGNVYEWNETVFDSVSRGVRGGYYGDGYGLLQASNRSSFHPTDEYSLIGFRVASEPSTVCLIGMGALGMLVFYWRQRRK